MDSYLERLRQAIASATRGITAEELANRPQDLPEGRWNVAEVLEHLYRTYSGTIKGFERCLQAGKPLATPITPMQRVRITLVTELNYFPRGRKSPEGAKPKGMSADKVLAEIAPQIAIMDELITQCEARYGSRTRVLDHPVLGPLSVRQWRKFHWVHGRHHVKQILRLRMIEGGS